MIEIILKGCTNELKNQCSVPSWRIQAHSCLGHVKTIAVHCTFSMPLSSILSGQLTETERTRTGICKMLCPQHMLAPTE